LGASLAQGHAHFSSGCGFYGGPNLKWLASTVAQILKVNSIVLGSCYSTGPCVWDFMISLGKRQPRAKFEVVAPAVVEILLGNPKFWGAPLVQGHPTFSSGCDFMMGLVKPSRIPNLKSLASAVAEIL